IICDTCGSVPVPDDQLPVVLPEDVAHIGHGSPLAGMPEFLATTCPTCGKPAQRETDTLDTFADSSWYFARFASAGADAMVDERANYWMPVDLYIGGIEHAVLHLLYSRFWNRVMRDEGLVQCDEPFENLLTQGMVCAETFYRTVDRKAIWYSPKQVDMERDERGKVIGATLKEDGLPVTVGRVEKMSKSKSNGVDPQDMVDRYGADTVRLYMMFTAPPDQKLEWSDSAVEGSSRFLKRLWKMVHDHVAEGPVSPLEAGSLTEEERGIRRKVHETVVKVSDDVGRRYTFNTAIAAVMELVNAMQKATVGPGNMLAVRREAIEAVLLLLAPIVPHVAQVLWRALGHSVLVVDEPWPTADAAALVRDAVTYVVQVNGKLRARIDVSSDADGAAIEAMALADENVERFVAGKSVRKVIVVPGRLVNVVVG
ncbi:MAG: class I tRNA ligase family protein, partial [Chromatiales bacterium]|nr:class I tRNA ligase family protein [Chromatiales bacterium]